MNETNTSETIKRIFDECRTIAVVGLSSNTARPSYGVAGYMKQQGYRVVPVNPNETEVHGETAYPTLQAAKEGLGELQLVNVFRRSSEAGAIVDEAIRLEAKAVWLQDDVVDEAAARRAQDAGLLVVMDRCWLRDYARTRAGR